MGIVNLSVTIKGIKFPNPVTVASGTFGTSDEFKQYVDYNRLGGVITKTVTPNPRPGNPMPRICETSSGMLNAIGLQNAGIDAFAKKVFPYFEKVKAPLIVNIAGETEKEYYELVKFLEPYDVVKALEINLSCPNVKKGCLDFQSNPVSAKRLLTNIRQETKKLVFTKLSPEAGDSFLKVAEATLDGGSDGLSLINTLKAMAVDLKTGRSKLANMTGGLSGPAIKPIALRYLYETKKNFDVPVIGIGGIMTAEDALEFLMVGADLISVGTANFVNPGASMEIIKGLEDFFRKEKVSLEEFRGSLKEAVKR